MFRPLSGEARQRYDALPCLICVADASGRLLWTNRAWQDAVFQGDSASTPTLEALAHPDDREAVSNLCTSPHPAPSPVRVDLRLHGSDGPFHWFRLDGQRLEPGHAEPGATLISGTTIDDLKAEQRQREVLQEVIDASPNCIKVLDLDARLLSMNRGGRVTMEIDDFDECRDLLWPSFWQGEARQEVEAAVERARAGESTTFEAAAATFKGTMKSWEVSVSPLRDAEGQIHQLSAVSRDITPRKTAEDALAALDAFVAFAEAVGTENDRPELARQAARVVQASVSPASVAYYELQGDLWKARVWSEDTAPGIAKQIQRGVPVNAPHFAEAARGRVPLFVDGWDAEAEDLPAATSYGAVALVPLPDTGDAVHLFTVGIGGTWAWTARERAIIRAVGRSLALAVERTATTRELALKNAELEARTRALDAFVRFTAQVATVTDQAALVTAATDIIRDAVQGSLSAYSQIRGNQAYPVVFSEHLPPALLPARGEGIPLERPILAQALGTREIAFAEIETGDRWLATQLGAMSAMPYFQGGQPVAVFTTSTDRPHWTEQEKAIVRAVGQGLGLALERVEHTRQVEEERAALDAFVAFSEASATTLDVPLLARHAADVLRATLGEVSAAFYRLEGGLWRAQVWSDDFSPELAAVIRAGIPVSAPSFAEVLQTRQALFVAGWQAAREGVASSEGYGAAAFFPCFVDDQPEGLLTIGTRRAGTWTAREQAIFRSVGRSLTLALERASVAARLQQQNAELDARTRALEGFALLTHDLTLQGEPTALIKRSMDMVLSLLPPGYASFWQVKDGMWCVTAQVGRAGSAELQAAIDAGLPVGTAPSLDQPARTGEPLFQDLYLQGLDTPLEMVRHINAVATLPVLVNGEVLGIYSVPLFEQRRWSAADRAVLVTTVRSLGLALESAQGVAQLAEERRKLEAANEELEAFAYSVSHDLRTPVRHIVGFVSLLRKSTAEQLDAKSARNLDIIDEAAQRMNTLIDAMLDLSRTSRLPLRQTEVDLGTLVERARWAVGPEAEGREVTWRLGRLPTVQGDPDTLQQVFVNLLSNALKYSRGRDVTVIEIWAEEQDSEWAVWVRDNGAGFDPRYQGKLFGVFQRLHHQDEFEGIGVGLANVRRIVQRHGGQVMASGAPGSGATFGFTLPRPPALPG